jgi:transposase
MIGVDKIGDIRRAYFEQHRPIKEIVRTLSVSRATVRKIVRGQETEHRYERVVQPTPKLGDWVAVLEEILEREAALPKRERRSTQRLFEDLRGRGYDGAHDSVHRYVKAWRNEQARVPAQAYVPMSFAPAEAYQFDWSHEAITLSGLPLTVKAAHMKLSHSRMPFVRVYFRETQELVFDAHDKAFRFYGGVCRRGIYDNMRRRWKRSSSVRPADTIAASCRCARIIWSNLWLALRPRDGRRVKSRTRSAICVTNWSGPSPG